MHSGSRGGFFAVLSLLLSGEAGGHGSTPADALGHAMAGDTTRSLGSAFGSTGPGRLLARCCTGGRLTLG